MKEINLCNRPGRCCPILTMDRATGKVKIVDEHPKYDEPYDTGWMDKEELLRQIKEETFPYQLTFNERVRLLKALE
jgi:hypothetical protein